MALNRPLFLYVRYAAVLLSNLLKRFRTFTTNSSCIQCRVNLKRAIDTPEGKTERVSLTFSRLCNRYGKQ